MYSKVFYVSPDSRWLRARGIRFAGVARGPFVFINKEYISDEGLLAHELVHVKQWWERPLRFSWHTTMHALFPRLYRRQVYAYELEAYREQLKHGGNAHHFAVFLATRYGLDVSVEQATADLTRVQDG